MRKIITLTLGAFLLSSLFGCANDKTSDNDKIDAGINSETVTEVEEDSQASADVTEENAGYTEEDGVLKIKHVSIAIPDGFSFNQDQNGTLVYSNEKETFAFYVEDDCSYEKEYIENAYYEQVKSVYGEQVTAQKKSFGGREYNVMNIDAEDNAYVGEAAVICDGKTLIYIEYVNFGGDEKRFEELMNSISY